MKLLILRIICLIPFSSLASAAVTCPDSSFVEKNIPTFSGSRTGTIVLDGQTWNFESTLTTSDIKSVKSLNREISDIDEHTCNYLIYLTDSNLEDASLLLHQRSTTRP